jgi:D-inositol-3-phosphate glycosyltransferase
VSSVPARPQGSAAGGPGGVAPTGAPGRGEFGGGTLAGPPGQAGPVNDVLRLGLVGIAWPMRGGIAQYTAILASELARRHRVDLVSFTRQYPSFLFPGKSQLDPSAAPLRFPSTPLVDSIGPWSWERAARHLARGRPDAVVYKYWMPFFAPAFGTIARRVKRICRPQRVRTIMVVDNLLPHERRPFDRTLTRYVMGATDAYIVQSTAVREDLIRLAPKARFLEVPHPVYNLFGEPTPKAEARAALGLPAIGPLLLFFGFVRRYKGLDTLLRALPAIRSALDPPPRLLVLGEFYEGRAETAALVRELGLDDAVSIVDEYVADEKVGRYFSAADAVVLPYRSATQSGIVQIAYQLDRPVICTDVGGLAEVVRDGETGFVVPPADPEALTRAVVRYLRDGCEDRFVERIRVEKRKYSWDRMTEAIEILARG